MNFLKAARILKELDGKPVSLELLLTAVSKINALSEKHLGHLVYALLLSANDPSKSHRGCNIYCEDDRLQLSAAGMQYKEIVVKGLDIAPLTGLEAEAVIDSCGAVMDLDALPCSEPAQKLAYKGVVSSPAVQAVCDFIRSSL